MAAVRAPYSSDYMGRRIEELARPKPFAPGFERDRRSVYWIEQEPPKPGPDGVTLVVASPRVQQLAQHRDPHRQWTGDRPSPEWPVSRSAQQASPSERLTYLGTHKTVSPYHKMERTPYMVVSPAAQTATPSGRIEQLAVPKNRTDPFEVYEKEWGQYFHVPDPALRARVSERLEYLSEPKRPPKEFQGEKPVQWPVSEQALKSLATIRLQQLSRPRSRTMIRDDFDPYKVSPAARKTRPTPRLEELAVPIPRKVRTKKLV